MLYRNYIKPPLDIFTAFVALIMYSPLFIMIKIVWLFFNNVKSFYYHQRPGKNEIEFEIIKFKIITDKKDKNGEVLPFHIPLTKLGNFMRKNSFDDFHRLINVIKSDMSIKGPRPLYIEYSPVYNETQARLHEIIPVVSINCLVSMTWNQPPISSLIDNLIQHNNCVPNDSKRGFHIKEHY